MSDVAIIVSVLVPTLAKFYVDYRNRKWDKADREAREAAAAIQRAAAAVSVKEEIREQGAQTQAMLADNTLIAQPNAEQLGATRARQEGMRDVIEQQSLDILHHSVQPVFDDLIDKYKAGTLSEQELEQFIQRAAAIAASIDNPAQLPAARFMLERALEKQTARNLRPREISRAEYKENVEAGEQMRVEAEPQKGQPVDGPQVTAGKVAELTERMDQREGKGETLKKTVDRIDQTTTEIKAAVDEAARESKE